MLKTFDELTVRLSLDSSNLQHRKLVFELVKPHIPGFSVDIMEVEDSKAETEKDQKKRKEETPAKSSKKSKKK